MGTRRPRRVSVEPRGGGTAAPRDNLGPIPVADGKYPDLAGIFRTAHSTMSTVCPTIQPLIPRVRRIPANGKTASDEGPGAAGPRLSRQSDHLVSDGGFLDFFHPGGFAFSPHCSAAQDRRRCVRQLAAKVRGLSVKNAG